VQAWTIVPPVPFIGNSSDEPVIPAWMILDDTTLGAWAATNGSTTVVTGGPGPNSAGATASIPYGSACRAGPRWVRHQPCAVRFGFVSHASEVAMPTLGKITVENPDEIRNTGAYDTGALIRVQTSSTETGTFADVSGTGSTPTIPVVAATRSYTFYDPNGIVSSWYRTRYENAGATRLSDWTPAFQVGDETAGLLCSLYDVQQELGGTQSANDNESILEKIRQVSTAIEGYIGQWLAPRPTNPASTTTLLFDVPYDNRLVRRYHKSLLLDRGSRLTGIRTLTASASPPSSQPDSGGSYTAATVADLILRPFPSADGPARRLDLQQLPDGADGPLLPGHGTPCSHGLLRLGRGAGRHPGRRHPGRHAPVHRQGRRRDRGGGRAERDRDPAARHVGRGPADARAVPDHGRRLMDLAAIATAIATTIGTVTVGSDTATATEQLPNAVGRIALLVYPPVGDLEIGVSRCGTTTTTSR
jgi:hypothetical protein